MKKIIVLLWLSLSTIACQNDQDINGDPADIVLSESTFLIFGHFYGECQGEGCVETFKLTGENLYEDTIDDYSASNFDFVALDNALFERVKDLADTIPAELLETEDSTFGCPDCSDGGGLHLEFTQNGSTKKWRVDLDKSNVPGYLHDFIDRVNEKIILLNQ
jgi:hypothetical protein